MEKMSILNIRKAQMVRSTQCRPNATTKEDKEVMIMENRLKKMGNELTTMLGFENDTVIAYWQAFLYHYHKLC